MTVRRTLMAIPMALVVAAVVAAAPAHARQTCENHGTATVCQTNGSASIAAKPGTTAPPANRPQLPWFIGD